MAGRVDTASLGKSSAIAGIAAGVAVAIIVPVVGMVLASVAPPAGSSGGSLSISLSGPTTIGDAGILTYAATGGTRSGYYYFSVVDSTGTVVSQLPVTGAGVTGSQGLFDSSGEASGSINISYGTDSVGAGSYLLLMTDSTTSASVPFTVD